MVHNKFKCNQIILVSFNDNEEFRSLNAVVMKKVKSYNLENQ